MSKSNNLRNVKHFVVLSWFALRLWIIYLTSFWKLSYLTFTFWIWIRIQMELVSDLDRGPNWARLGFRSGSSILCMQIRNIIPTRPDRYLVEYPVVFLSGWSCIRCISSKTYLFVLIQWRRVTCSGWTPRWRSAEIFTDSSTTCGNSSRYAGL